MADALSKLRDTVKRSLPARERGAARVLWGGMGKADDAASERTALIRLEDAIKRSFDASVDDGFLELLWGDLNYEFKGFYQTKAIAFSPPYPAPFSAEIARQVTASENIAGDHLEGFLSSVRRRLLDGIPDGDEDGQDDVEDSVEAWRSQAQASGSIMAEFIEKLSDIAPSRARLHVSIKILESYCVLARRFPKHSGKYSNFIKFSTRLINYYNHFCRYGHSLEIGIPTKEEGFDFSSNSRSLGLYDSLPVWFKLDDQISETISKNSHGNAETIREISFLPRLNGVSPENSQTSYENAATKIASEWEGFESGSAGWRLTRLFLLWVLTNPSNEPEPDLFASEAELENFFAARAAVFSGLLNPSACTEADTKSAREASLKRGVCSVSQSLKGGALVKFVSETARELLALLRTDRSRSASQGTEISRFLDNEKLSIYVNLMGDMIDPRCYESVCRHPFSEKNITKADLGRFILRSILVSTGSEVPSALYAYKIDYYISERSLRSKGTGTTKLPIARESKNGLGKRALAVTVPSDIGGVINIINNGNSVVYERNADYYKQLINECRAGSGSGLQPSIPIIYNSTDLDMPSAKAVSAHDYQESCILASLKKMLFTLASYVVMRRLVKSMGKINGGHDGLLQILKISPHGRLNAAETGSETVYAVFKALEINLRKLIRIKSQGYDAGAANYQGYRKTAVRASLDSAFRITLEGSTPLSFCNTGIVDYEIRPSDTNSAGDVLSFVTSVRTYLARTDNGRLNSFSLERSQSYTGTDRADDVEATHSNAVVKSALDYLVDKCGCETIILIGRQHGDRRIGRAADRHRQADPEKFLESLRATYPTVKIIPLVRKRAFVLRLKGLERGDSTAYEIIGATDHGTVTGTSVSNENCSSLLPLYSVATMEVVGQKNQTDETRPRSGLTTYSWLQGQSGDRYTDEIHRAREVLIDGGPAQKSLASILRSIHYVETEKSPRNKIFSPVLNPLTSKSAAEFGEIEITKDIKSAPRTHLGEVSICGPALFSRIDDVLEANEAKQTVSNEAKNAG
ncbi:hypothetical protein A0U91_16275 (plasmid) [Acetobacter persici]|uniref:Uncharacterized protein n=2 Tax=Acetobacter persici TaxID=1076596 RepID=A0A1U9LJC6_9PROT|nr:hypothetical protein A0U91_16275 [Acetobacter persici]